MLRISIHMICFYGTNPLEKALTFDFFRHLEKARLERKMHKNAQTKLASPSYKLSEYEPCG